MNNPTEEIQFTSRYGDGPLPDPAAMCPGECEGIGVYPLCNPPMQPRGGLRMIAPDLEGDELRLWNEAHAAAGAHDCDGWHFIKCPMCKGTGKRP